jgi:FtsH-binding integral membrane protein
MNREAALRVALVLVGLLFTAAIYPLTMMLWHRDQSQGGDAMMLSLYFTLGILLLLAVRNPSANGSLIAFAAWSSFAHGTVMSIMAVQNTNDRGLLIGVAILVVIGVSLLVLAPRKGSMERVSTDGAPERFTKAPTAASRS